MSDKLTLVDIFCYPVEIKLIKDKSIHYLKLFYAGNDHHSAQQLLETLWAYEE